MACRQKYYLALFWCAATVSLKAQEEASPETFATLCVGTQTFTGVVVTARTTTDVFINHAGGVTNLKVKSLDPKVQKQLGYEASSFEPSRRMAGFTRLKLDPRVVHARERLTKQVQQTLKRSDSHMLMGVLVGGLAAYLFFCYCCLQICRRTGYQPGLLVWVPVVQAFPMLKAAGMPVWWFVLLLLPVLNLIASMVWCLKIAQACGKSSTLGLLLFLPGTNLFTFLYLAFSGGSQEPEVEALQPIKLS